MPSSSPTNEKNNSAAAHALSPLKTSEFLGVALWAAASALQKAFPWTMALSSPSDDGTAAIIRKSAGLALVVAGAAVIRRVHVELETRDQPHRPGLPTTALVKTGPFRFSRNPTYAAVVFFFMPGLSLLFGNPWMCPGLVPVAVALFHRVMIEEEEAYLKGNFGIEWDRYCAETPRWI
jgi:protein-S-isoprenylcysteine O-methyltransferase Ste14